MINRHIQKAIQELALDRKKMAFVSGPRQCGKTTLAKNLLSSEHQYYNWDSLKFRQIWTKDPEQLASAALNTPKPRVVFDELHKNRRWKQDLKGFYDEYGDKIEIMVTGSARLSTYRKGGDSLLGRFYHFNLHPLSLSEYINLSPFTLDELSQSLHAEDPWTDHTFTAQVDSLFKFGGFPEPLLTAREDIHALWQLNRLELLIRQDLRDLSQIQEISQVEILAALLPLRVGSPLSVQSLREDLEVAFTTVQKWLSLLQALFYHFELKPYSKAVTRSLKKEGKIYLFDWSSVESPGPRFENMIASHLLKTADYYSDTGAAKVSLHYLRNKEKNEIDFVLIKNNKPWFTVEAKLNDLQLDSSYQVFQRQLHIPHVQIVKPSGIDRHFKTKTGPARVISFDKFFARMP